MSTAVQSATVQSVPTHSQLAMAYSVCSGVARSSARNFYYAFLVLPKPKRQALCAVYAFMRRCDDLSDDPSLPPRERRARLEAWLDAFHHAQAGEPTDDAILLALTDSQRRYQIPAELLDQLAFGTLMDVPDSAPEGPSQETGSESSGLVVQYRSFKDLYLYCYHVASVVGLVCIKIFGYRDPNAEHLAERCGIAFQLTNIIRDVKEDATMGRIYIPEEDLARSNLTAANFSPTTLADPAQAAAQQLRPALEYEADRARKYYESAKWLMELIHEDSRAALWVLVEIYSRLLKKITERNYDVLTERVRLTTWEKLKVLSRGFLLRIA